MLTFFFIQTGMWAVVEMLTFLLFSLILVHFILTSKIQQLVPSFYSKTFLSSHVQTFFKSEVLLQ